MEDFIPISFLNDFIFCPRSIYNHQLYSGFEQTTYQDTPQIKGKQAHQSIDEKTYSDKTTLLQGLEVCSNRYGIYGKIDMLDTEKHILTERKNNIKVIYDGYIFQLYAQYFALVEMGYRVEKIQFYDFSKNQTHPVFLPQENPEMLLKFEQTLDALKSFSLLTTPFLANAEKCKRCIYNLLCDKALC